MAVSVVWEFMIVLSLGLVGALMPVGVPPLPEDPALLRMAPADSVAYVSWFGHADEGQPGNRSEALLAEPEMAALGHRLLEAVRETIIAESRMDAEGAALARDLFALSLDALKRPGCVFVALPRGGPMPRIGLVLEVGEEGDSWRQRMRVLESRIAQALQRMEGEEPATDPEPVGDVSFRALPLPADGPTVAWAVADRYLMLSVGTEAATSMVAGLRGEPGLSGTPLLQSLRAEAQVDRPALRTFVNAGPLLELAKQTAAQTGNREDLDAALALLGLDQVEGLLSESGLQGEGYATSARLQLKARKGVFDLFGAQPLGVDDLALVPKDATVALGLSLDADKTLDWILSLVELDYDGASQEFEDEILSPMRDMLGVDLRKDLLAHLGDKIVVWNSPGQGGALFTGLCAAVPLADGQAFGEAFSTLMERMEQIAPEKRRDERGRIRRDYYLEEEEHAGRVFWWLNPVGDDDLPFGFSWTATDTHFLFGFYPQVMRDTLERGADLDSSLARSPAVAGYANVVALEYFDARGLLERFYPVLPMLFTLGAVEWQREGFDLTVADLPRLSSLLPHLGSEVSVLQADDTGLQLTRKGTIPVLDPALGAMVPMAMLPLMFYARSAQMRRFEEVRRQALEAERRAKEAKEEAEKRRRGK